jgi:hypothetical protein
MAAATKIVTASFGNDLHQATLAFGRRGPGKLVTVVGIDDTTGEEKTVALLHLLNMSSSQQDKAATVAHGGTEACAHVVQADGDENVRALAAALLARLCQLREARQRLVLNATGAVATLLSMASEEHPACRHAAADVLSTITSFPDCRYAVVDADGAGDEADDGTLGIPPAVNRIVTTFAGNIRLVTPIRFLCADPEVLEQLLACGILGPLTAALAGPCTEHPEAYRGALDVSGSGSSSAKRLLPPVPLPKAYVSASASPSSGAQLSEECLLLLGAICASDAGVRAAIDAGTLECLPAWFAAGGTRGQREAGADALAAICSTGPGAAAVISTDLEAVCAGLGTVVTEATSPEPVSAACRAMDGLLATAMASTDAGLGLYTGVGGFATQWSLLHSLIRADESGDVAALGVRITRLLGPPIGPAAAAAACDESVGRAARAASAAVLAALVAEHGPSITAESVAEGFACRATLGHSEGTGETWSQTWADAAAAGSTAHSPGARVLAAAAGVGEALLGAVVLAHRCGDVAAVMRLGAVLGAVAAASEVVRADAAAAASASAEIRGLLLGADATGTEEGCAATVAPELVELLCADK